MDDDAQLARDLVLARRLKLGVRLVLYPLLLGALVLALHARHAHADGDGGGDGPLVKVWHGSGERIGDASIGVADGEVKWVRIVLVLSCSDGSESTFTYTPSNLERHGATVTARRVHRATLGDDASTDWYSAAVELPVPDGEAPVSGMASASETWSMPTGATRTCGGPQARRFTVRP